MTDSAPTLVEIGAPSPPEEFAARLRAQGTRYHNLHPFHLRMDAGELSREELRRWVTNRFYYQKCIPLKDAAIMSNCPEVEIRREWIQRIIDHDGTGEGTGGIESWLALGEALGVTRAELVSEHRVLPAVRYAVDAYVNFARRRPWIEAVASSLTELFGPSAIKVRVEAMERHYDWIDPAGPRVLPHPPGEGAAGRRLRSPAHRRALPDASQPGRGGRRPALQDRAAVGAARRDRARRHAAGGSQA